MRKLIVAALAVLLFALPAGAGQNLRQLETGGAEWVRGTAAGGGEVTHPVGAVYLQVLYANLASEATYAVISPITDARVSLIQVTSARQLTGADAVFHSYIISAGNGHDSAPPIALIREITDGSKPMTISVGDNGEFGGTPGLTDTFTPNNVTNAWLQRGDVILIHGDGGPTAQGQNITGEARTPGTIVITIVPRGN